MASRLQACATRCVGGGHPGDAVRRRRPDRRAGPRRISRMAGRGVAVMTPNGNTGEFYALAPEDYRPRRPGDRRDHGRQGVVISGVGFDMATAVAMGRSAIDAGADGVMIHQPLHPYRLAAVGSPTIGHRLGPCRDGGRPLRQGPGGDRNDAAGARRRLPERRRREVRGRRRGAVRGLVDGLRAATWPGSVVSRSLGPRSSGWPAQRASPPGLANVEPGLSLRMLSRLARGTTMARWTSGGRSSRSKTSGRGATAATTSRSSRRRSPSWGCAIGGTAATGGPGCRRAAGGGGRPGRWATRYLRYGLEAR